MDPQAFIRLSIGSLGLRLPSTVLDSDKPEVIQSSLSSSCCQIRLRGFPIQTALIPFLTSPDITPDYQNVASSFYLEESDLKTLLTSSCFHVSKKACLEIIVFNGKKGTYCGVRNKKEYIGTVKLAVSQEWGQGKPVILFSGWIGLGKNKHNIGKPRAELHVRVKLDPDPRYIFQFEDEIRLSPQIVQLQGTLKQPIFSCEFSQDRVFQLDALSNSWSNTQYLDQEVERRERKGWKVKIHDLSGSVVAAAFITTPFVPATGCDWVAKSNPGAWLIVRPDACRPNSWQPWGKLEAWRERGLRDFICCRFHLLSEEHENGDVLMSEIMINCERGGEFFIDTSRQVRASTTPVPSPKSSGDYSAINNPVASGFVMSCRVQGEGKCSKPLVQLAMRHITCIEDAAIFMALAASVGLSIEACRTFRRKLRRGARHSW